MATTASLQAASAVQPAKHSLSGLQHTQFGYKSIASAPSANDVIQMVKVPAKCLVVGGYIQTTDMDSNGSPTLELDVGWADNGAASATQTVADGTIYTNMVSGAASATGLVDSGVMSGTAVTGVYAAGNFRPFFLPAGAVYFAAETMIQVKVTAAAATFAAGTMVVKVDYISLG